MTASKYAKELTQELIKRAGFGDDLAIDRLNKLAAAQKAELAKRAAAGDGLAVDHVSRMARAKADNFGDDTFYHATGADIKAFDNSRIGTSTDEGWFGRGHYTSPNPEYANQFVPTTGNANVVPVKLRANNQYDWRANELDNNGRGMAIANDEMRQAKTDELINAGYSGVDVYDDVIKLGDKEKLTQDQWQTVKNYYEKKMGSHPQWLKKEMVENTLRKGAPRHTYVEQYGEDFAAKMPSERILKERMVFDPKNIRSVNAAFDPAKRESSNLLASLAPMAVGGVALAQSDESDAMFLGKLAKGADKAMLDMAEQMKKSGVDAGEIWRKTGWGEGADGKWRFEVDDSPLGFKELPSNIQAEVDKGGIIPAALTDHIDAPHIYSEYPDLQDARLSLNSSKNGGGYEANDGFSERFHLSAREKVASPDSARETAAHELQHSIARREGFSPGSSRVDFSDEANDQYLRAAGEVEARNTEKRIGMTMRQRKEIPPWVTEDVPRSSQLLNYSAPAVVFSSAIAAGLTPEQAQAASEVPVGSSMNDLLNYGQQQVMEIEETPWAENSANFIDKWTQTPIGSPLEGTSNYLRNLGRKKSALSRAADSIGLGLDFF